MASRFNSWSRICISVASFILQYSFMQVIFGFWAILVFFIVCRSYIPNVYATREVRLNFEGFPKQDHVFAATEFSLLENYQSIFTIGQPYRITFHLRIPDSAENRDSGMSVVQLSMFDVDGKNTTVLSNTLLPTFRPWLIDAADTFLFAPLYLTRMWEKEQLVIVPLADSFINTQESESVRGLLRLTANRLRWYSATLCISAELTSFARLLYTNTGAVGLLFVSLMVISLDFLLVFFFVFHHRQSIMEQISCLLSSPSVNVGVQTVCDEEEKVDLSLIIGSELLIENANATSTSIITVVEPDNDLSP